MILADRETVKRLERAALQTKLDLFRLCNQTLIHIGGDLSCCEIMTVVWQYLMRYDVQDPRWEGRDRFILSKGHAAAVTSFSQAAIGCYDKADIYKEYGADFGRFAMHSCNLRNPYVDVSTGSLGMGLQVATGLAAGLRLKGNHTSRIYTVMGDGECAEGSVYEAAELAAAQKMGNIVAFIDRNGMTLDGYTKDLMPLRDLRAKFEAFGWNAYDVKDGNSIEDLLDACEKIPAADSDKPTVFICHTVKGHGVSFMANTVAWHAGSISDELHAQCIEEVTNAYKEKWGEI